MTPGDLLVTFSDGVTEALNPAGEEFTDDRLIASIQTHREKPLAQLVDTVLGDVRAFCAGATQSDDITLVMVRFNG